MIAQIRVHDYNLERCSIASDIPEPAALAPQARTLTLAGGAANLEVWELDGSAGELDLTTLSWRTRPARTVFLSSLRVEQGQETFSAEFDCGHTASLRTFEFACAEGEEECSVEFWQEQPEKKPRMGERADTLLAFVFAYPA